MGVEIDKLLATTESNNKVFELIKEMSRAKAAVQAVELQMEGEVKPDLQAQTGKENLITELDAEIATLKTVTSKW